MSGGEGLVERRLGRVDPRERYEEVVRLVEPGPPGFLTVGGERVPVSGEPVEALSDALYRRWYLQLDTPPPVSGPLRAVELDLAAALRGAHAGSEAFGAGWRAGRVSTHGRVEAVREGSVRLLERCDYVVPGRGARRAEPGDELLVVDRIDFAEEAGFWVTHLGAWPPEPPAPLVRVYWRVSLDGAPALVRLLTVAVSDVSVPAALKVVADASAFGRADALVLYVARDALGGLAGALRDAARRMEGSLRDPPPRLTRRVAPGVGLAEGPADGASFGQSRCRLIAAALAAAGAGGPGWVERGVAAIRRRLDQAGIDPDRSHLSVRGADDLDW